MNRSTKVILITGGALVGAGIILGGIGFAVSGFTLRNNFEVTYEQKEAVITEDFNNINIQEVSDDIMLIPSDGDEVRIEYYDSNIVEHTVEVSGDTLYITVDDLETGRHWWENVRFSFDLNDDDESHKTIIYLPAGDYGKLDIDCVSADVSLPSDYSFTSFDLECVSSDATLLSPVSGSVTINGVSSNINLAFGDCDSVSVTTVSGDIDVADTRAQGSFRINTTSGNISMSRSNAGSTGINTISGDIRFEDYETTSLDIDTTSGDISGNLIGEYSFETNTVSGDISLPSNVNGGSRADIDTVSGDIYLR